MRVIQAMGSARFGGAEAFFARLCPALARAGVEQYLLLRYGSPALAQLSQRGLATEELPFGGRLDVHSRPAFRRAIEAFGPAVVLTWMSRATRLCPRARRMRHRFVHVARLGGYYKLKYYRHCDHLIANTNDIVRYVVEAGWPPARAHYLPNFVDADPSPPVPRESLDTPASGPLILALGRLHENKGFDVLLRALAELPECHLWLAGSGPLEARLRADAAALGVGTKVRFLGWRDDAAALYRAADVVVCPSRHEPLGNVVIEAWAHGVPVVAAAAVGPKALIADGINGLLAPVADAEALAAAISRLLAAPDLAAGLAAAGRRDYHARFTEPAVVAKYVDFLERIVC